MSASIAGLNALRASGRFIVTMRTCSRCSISACGGSLAGSLNPDSLKLCLPE
jgi:hypothetical protein